MGKDTPQVQAIAKGTTKGQPATVVNTLQTKAVVVNLHLQWKDPEDVARDFPVDFEVIPVLHLSNGTKQDGPVQKVKANGRLTFLLSPTQSGLISKTWSFEKVSLKFKTTDEKYILCEPRLDATKTCVLATRATINGLAPDDRDRQRGFSLPKEWTMALSDWAVESTDEPKSWDDTDKAYVVIIKSKRHDVGTKAKPVKMTLDPHWQYLRWVYYDRWLKGDKRLSILQIFVEGYMDKATLANDPDSRSNWNAGGVADGKEAVQCLPWIIQKPDAMPAPKSLIRFKTKANTFIRSQADTGRTLVSGTERKTPDYTRLRYYDLPEEWRSTKYYGRLAGPVKEKRWEQIVIEKTKLDRPLTFSLDDMVLVDKDLKPITWVPDDRVAIISHLFDNVNPETNAAVADLSDNGVYKPDTAAKMSYFSKKPEASAVEKDRNYISDYPDWTRLLAAKGNLFDVFSERTKESSPPVADEVIGARAAVRWVEGTAPFAGIKVWKKNTVSGNWEEAADGIPQAERIFHPSRPAKVENPFFTIHPFFEQRYGVRYREAFDPAKDEGGGRFDMCLVRCSNVVDRKEIAVNLHYFRFAFQFNAAPAIGEADYKDKIISNVNNRWNGKDGTNSKRAWLLPQIDKPIKVPVVWFGQSYDAALSHFKVEVHAHSANARDNRNGSTGMGESTTESYQDPGNFFASAHENGHADALPDEYNERWDGASYGQLSYKSNLPGDPFEPDGRGIEFDVVGSPMMNGNQTMRNRYFWQSAEFVRRCYSNIGFKVSYDTFTEYIVPPHPTAGRTFTYWPIEHMRNYAAAAVAPLTGTRGKADLYLYTLGKDKWPIDSLPAAETPAGATPYDGVLVVIVKLKVTLPALPEADRKLILQAMTGAMRRLNNKFYATGKVRQGTDQKWEFKRCLIQFSPRYLVANFVHATNATFAADIDTIHGSHFEVEVAQNDPAVSQWTGTPPVPTPLSSLSYFEGKLPSKLKDDARLTTVKTAVTDYHALDIADLAKRLEKLKTIIDQNGAIPENIDLMGDWATASAGPKRGANEDLVDSALASFGGIDAKEYGLRLLEIDKVISAANANNTHTKALKKRAEQKKVELRMLKAVANLAKEAEKVKTYLETQVTSTKLRIQYKTPGLRQAQVEDAFFKNFPGMLGIYKLPADLLAADLLPVVSQVVTTTPAVVKI
jgi:hypothetical protein